MSSPKQDGRPTPSDSSDKRPLYGLMAEFQSPKALVAGARQVHSKGFRRWDAHTPFPLHELEEAMGLGESPIGRYCLCGSILGLLSGFSLQAWSSAVSYPLVVSGKPFLSWPAFVPISFELAIAGGAIGALAAFFRLSGLPQLHHPLFESDAFERATDDAFFLVIEATDPQFELAPTRQLLRSLKATDIHLLTLKAQPEAVRPWRS